MPFVASALALSLSALGCIAGTTPNLQPTVPPPDRPHPGPDKPDPNTPYATQFQRSLGEMARLDAKGVWAAEDCERVAKGFLGVAGEGNDAFRANARFNAGVAYERCHRESDAEAEFEAALKLKADFHPAKVHVILARHRRSGGKDIDSTLADLRRTAIVEARYQNVEALVALAMLSLERNNSVADTDGATDRARAVRYLQSALAVDDGYSPAMNGLALYYLDEARSGSGRKVMRSVAGAAGAGPSSGTQAMELAALVCSQALRKDPSDAVIHNTFGLIQVELGNLGKAAEEFGKARALRPGFYEAEMNFAAVNLQFRGFTRAEEAYRAVLSRQPDDYDARVGLSLALRGQIQPDSPDTLVDDAAKELERAKKIAPDRPEAYYNQAILTQEYKARGEPPVVKKQLDAAQDLFREFTKKASSAPAFADAVKRADERIKEIDEVKRFLEEGAKSAGNGT